MKLVYNEKTEMWKEKKEPYAVVEFETKEDYDRFCEIIEFWNKYHKQNNS